MCLPSVASVIEELVLALESARVCECMLTLFLRGERLHALLACSKQESGWLC